MLALLSTGVAIQVDKWNAHPPILELGRRDETEARIAGRNFQRSPQKGHQQTKWRKLAMTGAQATHDTGQSKKAAASGWIGSALEYYDPDYMRFLRMYL